MDRKRFEEAVRENEEATLYLKAYIGYSLLRLGHVENARSHFILQGYKPDQAELQKVEAVEKHINKCTEARRLKDWTRTIIEAEAAIASGAETSPPQLFACIAEAYLKLHQLEDAEFYISKAWKYEPSPSARNSKIFGTLIEAYIFSVKAQIELALGRFGTAHRFIVRAAIIDLVSAEITDILKNVKLTVRDHARGNDLYNSEKYTEACEAYGEGLRLCPLNAVLYCNRAACWLKLKQWKKSLDDCSQALLSQPNYTKALLQRAASNAKLQKWTESLFDVQVALKKSRGEDVQNMKFGGKVESVSSLEQFRAAISSSDICRLLSSSIWTMQEDIPILGHLKHQISFNKFSQGGCGKDTRDG